MNRPPRPDYESLNYRPSQEPKVVVEDVVLTDHSFLIGLNFGAYSMLAKIRNDGYADDATAVSEVVRRGLIELEGETQTKETDNVDS